MDDLDRRRPVPVNVVFEATDAHDPTATYFFHAFRSEDDTGVVIAFTHETTMIVRDMMFLDADQCEEFGRGLLAAAKIARTTDSDRKGTVDDDDR